MNKKMFLGMAALVLLPVCGIAQAAAIQGSTAWNIFGSISGSGHTFTMPQPTGGLSGMFAQTGMGDFSIVPCVFPTNITWLSSSALDVANPAGWTFGSAAFGKWVTTSGSHSHSALPGINVSLQGVFTPGTMFDGLTQSQGLMSLGFIMNGNTASNVSGSMAMNPVPEPSSIIALVGGLGSLLAFRRRKV